MSDDPAHVLCDSVAECQAALDDLDGGSISGAEALKRIRAELEREDLKRAMWAVGYFPADTPPPVVLAADG